MCALLHRAIARSDTRCVVLRSTCVYVRKLCEATRVRFYRGLNRRIARSDQCSTLIGQSMASSMDEPMASFMDGSMDTRHGRRHGIVHGRTHAVAHHVSAASLAFFNRCRLAAVATRRSTRLLFLSPLGPWLQRSLRLPRSLYLKHSSFCCFLVLRNEPAFHVLLSRFLDPSEPLTRLLRCQRPVFRVGGQVEQR